MKKMRTALKKDGVIYASFKYGNGTKFRGERRFSDFNEKIMITLFEAAGFEIIHRGYIAFTAIDTRKSLFSLL